MKGCILLVDDDRTFRLSTMALLKEEGHEVEGAASAAEAVEAVETGRFDLVLMDLRMPGLSGIDGVEILRKRGEGIPVLMISGFGTVDTAVKALHTGVDDFLTKPVEPEVLLERVANLLHRRPGTREGDEETPAGMIGRAEAMRRVYGEIRKVAPTEATVLVTGETGTGKELVARAIHQGSKRSGGPFVTVNCAALSEGILESELFGHRRGAFTGAVKDKRGLFEAAAGGTLFLDEIGDVTPAAQQRLLRAVQEREVVPVGGVHPVPVDVRLVAATNRNLRADVEAGRFREDLFFRLNVYRVDLPALRERRGDLPLLAEHYLRTRAQGERPLLLSPLALRLLLAHRWPGNIRELFAALESAAIRCDGTTIQAQNLPPEIRDARAGSGAPVSERYNHPGSQEGEKEAIQEALRQADGVRTRAAELLGMGRTTLWRKMKEYGLEEG
jgi:two-component system response regulator HydG